MTERKRRTDNRKNFNALEAVYQRFEKDNTYQIPAAPAEPPLEPPPGSEKDRWFLGKEMAVRITQFIAICPGSFQCEEFDQIYFATELAALNVFNAQDSPISAPRREAARQAAYDYYNESLAKIPNTRR